MIKGLIALFTSGAIFHPLVLLGVILGIVCDVTMNAAEIKNLFSDYHLYLLVLLVSALYVFGFKRVYKDGGREPDYAQMTFQVIWGVVKFVLAALLSISFVELLRF